METTYAYKNFYDYTADSLRRSGENPNANEITNITKICWKAACEEVYGPTKNKFCIATALSFAIIVSGVIAASDCTNSTSTAYALSIGTSIIGTIAFIACIGLGMDISDRQRKVSGKHVEDQIVYENAKQILPQIIAAQRKKNTAVPYGNLQLG